MFIVYSATGDYDNIHGMLVSIFELEYKKYS